MHAVLSATLTAPVIIPLAGALIGALLGRRPGMRRMVSVATLVATLAYILVLAAVVFTSGPVVTAIGNWPAPFGIVFVADGLSVLMLLMACGVGLAVLLYSFGDADPEVERYSFHPLFLIQILGVNGAFLAGDIFNLYVWFEVLLTASFALLCAGATREQLQAGIPYLVLNLMASTIFLTACGLLYGVAGTLNIADLAQRFSQLTAPGITTVLAVMFLLGYAIKAGVFPLFSWLPTSYHTPPVAVTALFSALMTKVGVYALLRIFPLVFPGDLEVLRPVILISATLTMVVGVLGALAQYNIRRLLSYHIISQVGYLLMGLGVGGPAAIAATALFIVHVSIAKAALFMIGGVAERDFGTPDLRYMGGMVRSRPGMALLFGLAALSLAGIPPLSGFVAKLALVQATFTAGEYLVGGISLAVSLLTLLSMLKIWNEAFWKDAPGTSAPAHQHHAHDHAHTGSADHSHDHDRDPHTHDDTGMPRYLPGLRRPAPQPVIVLPIIALVALTVALGLAGEPAMQVALQAARDTTSVPAYVELVLGPPGGQP